jgi:hypothetical protein
MQTYTIRLTGDAVADARVPVSVARELLAAIETGARGAVRLRLEGRSLAKGPVPTWLRDVSDFDLISVSHDEPGIRISAPSLSDALPDRFRQTELFAPVDPETSALALLSDSLHDAVSGQRESDGYDEALLNFFHRGFREVLKQGIDRIELRNGRADAPAVVVTERALQTVEALHDSTPEPRRVRLAGWLDAIRYSDRAFTLKLESGLTVRGVLVEGAPEQLSGHFGQLALVSGIAHYRPSGTLLRIDAERIAAGTERDAAVWGAVPDAPEARIERHQLHRPQGPRTGLAALIGTWPGDESDEEIFAALEE